LVSHATLGVIIALGDPLAFDPLEKKIEIGFASIH
jgi:hypothetical protein